MARFYERFYNYSIKYLTSGGYPVYEYNQKDIRTDDEASVLASGNLVAGNPELGPKLFALLHK